jgi:uncharacterized membrane protein
LEITSYIILTVITLVFSVLALLFNEQKLERILLKLFSGIMWLSLGILWLTLSGSAPAAADLAVLTLFWAFGFLFFLSTMQDWRVDNKEKFGRGLD